MAFKVGWVNRIIHNKFFIWLCSGIIIPLIIVPAILQFYIEPAAKNKMSHQQELINLKELLRKLFYRDAETYRFCSESKNKIKDKKYKLDLDEINSKRDQTFEELVNYTLQLADEKRIHQQSYNEIKSFTRWNNNFYFAHHSVCELSLKSPLELQKWRDSIIKAINSYQ